VVSDKPGQPTAHHQALDSLIEDMLRRINTPIGLTSGPWPLTGDEVGIGDDVHRALLADDWADSGMRPNQLRKLVDVQVVTRKRQLGGDHPRGRDVGITVEGNVVGRILLDLDDDSTPVSVAAITLVDIAIHPQRQRQGIGSEVLRSVLVAAGNAKRPVRHSAVFGTAALTWLTKSGFVDTGGDALYRKLEWRP
jgi:ribosomal protein S18 acetylase RimI-like enzyme